MVAAVSNRLMFAEVRTRPTLRYVLPVAQVGFALGLLSLAHHRSEMLGSHAAWKILLGVNAPLISVRFLWWDVLAYYQADFPMGLLADGVSLVAVGLLWHGVTLNLEAWRQRRSVLNFKFRPLRAIVDVMLLSLGLFFGFFAVYALAHLDGIPPNSTLFWLWWVPDLLQAFFSGLWGLALAIPFGRDLVLAAKPSR